VIIYGWLGHPTVLAQKQDLCATCGVAGPHAIVRIARWGTIFWAPFVPDLGQPQAGVRQLRRADEEPMPTGDIQIRCKD